MRSAGSQDGLREQALKFVCHNEMASGIQVEIVVNDGFPNRSLTVREFTCRSNRD